MKRTLCILLSLMLALTGLAGLCVPVSAYDVGDIIFFGNYPQTKVSESATLKNAANAATWKSYGYYIGTGSYDGSMAASDFMQYADFISGDFKYRAVKFSKFRPGYTSNTSDADNSYQDDNGYSANTTYYFRFEPMQWRVLDPSTGLVMCENLIDAQAIQNVVRQSDSDYYIGSSSTYANNYAESTIRTWLNNDFYNTAFITAQKNKIKSTTVHNSAFNPAYSQYDAASTTNPIFLLSYNEAKNSSYGFSSDSSRKAKGTDYAKCQGLHVESTGFSDWWLRTPGSDSYNTCYIFCEGYVNFNRKNDIAVGIRPACRLTNLKSDFTQFEKHTVTTAANPTAGGTVSGGGTYTDGQTATVTATNNSGYIFSGWYNGSTKVSSAKSYSFTVIENVTLTAKFSPLSMSYTVTATANPSEGGIVSGGGSYSAGQTATVTATPNSGWRFTGWFEGSNKVSSNASYSFTVTGKATLTAKFEKAPTIEIDRYVESRKIDYRTTITFSATQKGLPPDGRIVWVMTTASGETTYKSGEKLIVNEAKEDFVFHVRAEEKTADGFAVVAVSPEEHVYVKKGFFDRLKAFLRNLFHKLPDIAQEYLGAEIRE